MRRRAFVLEQLKDGGKTTDQLYNGLKEKHPRQVSSRRSLVNVIRGIPEVTNPDLNNTHTWKLKEGY